MKSRICANDFCISDRTMWLVPMDYPFLFGIDINSGSVVFKKRLETFKNYTANRGYFEKIVRIGTNIVGIPYWSDYVFVHNTASSTTEYYWLNEEDDKWGSGYCATAVFGEKVFSFQRTAHQELCRNQNMLLIDLIGEEIGLIKNADELHADKTPHMGSIIRRDTYQADDKAYLINGNRIIELFKDGTKAVHGIKGCQFDLTSICRTNDANKFCVADKAGNIAIWDVHTEQVNIIGSFKDNRCPQEYIEDNLFYEAFGYSVKYMDRIIILPYMLDCIIEVDTNNYEVKKATYSDALCINPESVIKTEERYYCGQFSEPHIVGDRLIVWNLWSGLFFEVNMKSGEVSSRDIIVEFSREECKDALINKPGTILFEEHNDSFYTVEGFIDSLIG